MATKKIHVHTGFTLNYKPDDQRKFAPGIHEVDEEIADHAWTQHFAKALPVQEEAPVDEDDLLEGDDDTSEDDNGGDDTSEEESTDDNKAPLTKAQRAAQRRAARKK